MNSGAIVEGLLWYLAFLFSTTCHEASHAFAAYFLGDTTAYEGGQATLNPLPHIRREPVGTVLVPIISYLSGGWMIGWASAPYNFLWSIEHPRRMGMMSLAGPAANFIILLSAAVLIRLGMSLGVFVQPDTISFEHAVAATTPGFYTPVAMFLSILFSLNLVLGCFNLLPVPPLDGRGIVALLLPTESARKALLFLRNPYLAFAGLFLAWRYFGNMLRPIYLFCINLLFPGSHYR
jgi:Zn-dependent protease